MKNYLRLLSYITATGIRQHNRTGTDTVSTIGEVLRFDLRDGFPAVTTKKLAFNSVKGELLGFLRGTQSLAEFKELGCNVWDANVAAPAWQDNPNCQSDDDMGRIYGTQWRDWPGVEYKMVNDDVHMARTSIDQLHIALETIRHNPESRRIIVTAWNPAELDQACLPPCHVMFQFFPRTDGTLHMTVYMRSVDTFLGMPFNIASYALLLSLFAAWTGRVAATMTMFYGDTHVYVNHVDQVLEQCQRAPFPLPKLVLEIPVDAREMTLDELVKNLEPEHIELVGYNFHPAIKAPMAV